MPLLGYKKQFAPLVESGEKRQTIRAMRKRPFRIGDRLYHYAGLRTRQCRKLLESDCTSVETINIWRGGIVIIEGLHLTCGQRESLAYADGFRDIDGNTWERMFEFFRTNHSLPFTGQLIKW